MSKTVSVMDIECYPNYFLVALMDVETGGKYYVELTPGKPPLRGFLPDHNHTFVTFNGINYDFPMLSLALGGANNSELKLLSDDIIVRGLKRWEVVGGVDLSGVDHIDIMEVTPGKLGLKMYGGRLHTKRMQDLPFDPSKDLSQTEQDIVREYCFNDLEITLELYQRLKPQLELRERLSLECGVDLRSKSDAQVGETIIKRGVESIKNQPVYRPDTNIPNAKFYYSPPPWMDFKTQGMRDVLRIFATATFGVTESGAIDSPGIIESACVRIGGGEYKLGIGGIHSMEKRICHIADGNVGIYDRDVVSYYPSIILNQGLYPSQLGPEFLEVYGGIVKRRVGAKKSGDEVLARDLKTPINGPFGKFGSMWSCLYAPHLMIQVTLTGQLALLMLIEMLEGCGLKVVSANTDGIVIKAPVKKKGLLDSIIKMWEMCTGFETEETEYASLHIKDVNNYIAVKPGGKTKVKGIYDSGSLSINPTTSVCTEAVIRFLTGGVPIELSVMAETDVRKFVSIRSVKGGAVYGSDFLGKAVRWYYAVGEKGHLTYKLNGNKVPKTDGARPMMTLVDTLPSDIDYQWYIDEARSILEDIGG